MSNVINFDQTSNGLSQDVIQKQKHLVEDLLVEYANADTLHKKLEISKAINSAYNTSINAVQVTVNSIKVAIDARESQLKFSGLLNDADY